MTAATASILVRTVGRTAERRARGAVAEAAGRVGIDLVAAGHPRDLLAGEQDDVERRRREADERLDPAPHRELRRGAVRHGARL